jgi:fucose permease
VLVAVAAVAFFVFSMFPVSLAMGSDLAGVERTGIGVGIIFGVSGLSGAAVQPIVGGIADRTGLQVALSLLIVVAVMSAVVALTLPSGRHGDVVAVDDDDEGERSGSHVDRGPQSVS